MNKWSSSHVQCCHWRQGICHSLQLSCQCLGVLLWQFMFLMGVIKTNTLCLFSSLSLDNSEVLMILAKSSISSLVCLEGRWLAWWSRCMMFKVFDMCLQTPKLWPGNWSCGKSILPYLLFLGTKMIFLYLMQFPS